MVRRLGLAAGRVDACRRAATQNGSTLAQELVANGIVSAGELRDALAAELGIASLWKIHPGRLMLRDDEAVQMLRRGLEIGGSYEEPGQESVYLVCAETADPEMLEAAIARRPAIVERLRLVTGADLRQAVIGEMEAVLTREARDGLFLARPSYSARYVANAWQGLMLGALAVALPVYFWVDWQAANVALHTLLSAFFLACVALRFVAMLTARPLRLPRLGPRPQAPPPVYTVLVALYREAAVVPQLLKALSELEWPRSRLEIKLICEADDAETIEAITALKPPAFVEIVKVPPSQPRTKPKALAYALPLCSGSLVALYDAEDRPHPEQLMEAWQAFAADREGAVACLQAPLVVTNDRAGSMARLFAFEYAALFRALLPWLGRRRLLVPLGGTSNHFRREALDEVGGWDPYNVTEDADLGARLARHGYAIDTITRPTFEDGPDSLAIWLPQRTRWFKGWMQSWLVHMRNPARLARELGPGSFLVLQVLFLGMVVSALVHPFFVASLLWVVAGAGMRGELDAYGMTLLGIDAVNILGGYVAFLLIGWRTLSLRENVGFPKVILFTPVYWLLLSYAAWRAIWQLYRRPHHWDKTPHLPTVSPSKLQARLSRRRPAPPLTRPVPKAVPDRPR